MTTLILVVNGPNLNLLGEREPEVYGRETLADIEKACRAKATELGLGLDFRQSNSEAEIVAMIQEARRKASGIVVNAAALTHSSVAILDALQAAGLPVIEVHLSNIFRREDFRHRSFVSRAADGVICGLRGQGYVLALEAMAHSSADAGEELLPREVGHRQVEQDEADLPPGEEPHHFAAVLARSQVVDGPGALQGHAQTAQPGRLVVDQQDGKGRIEGGAAHAGCSLKTGRVNVALSPSPGAELKARVPPCSLTMPAEIESPSPLPLVL